jgi:putative flippase GtrA
MFDSLLTDRETQLRLLRFLVVGGGSALVQVAVLRSLRSRLGETLAFSVSWMVSTTTHYFANRFWALPSTRDDTARQLGEYLVAVALSYLINLAELPRVRAVRKNPLAHARSLATSVSEWRFDRSSTRWPDV